METPSLLGKFERSGDWLGIISLSFIELDERFRETIEDSSVETVLEIYQKLDPMLRIAKAEGEKTFLDKFIFNCLANMLDYGPADEDVFKGTYHSLIAPLLPLIKLQNIDFYNKFVIL